MKQQQYTYETKELFEKSMIVLKETIGDGKHAMFQIFSDQVAEESFEGITDVLNSCFPNAVYLGCTTSGNIVNCKAEDNVSVICTWFEDESTKVYIKQYDLNDDLKTVTAQILSESKKIPNLRALELYFTITEISHSEFCKRLEDIEKDVHIFGAVSCSPDISASDSLVCSKGNPISDHALVVVFYSGENLHIESLKATGWKPIGRQFEITKAQGEILYELDGIPAYNIYNKYLNIENDDNFFVNTLEFPLFYQDNDEEILKVPLVSNSDNSLVMSAELETGKKVRLSYGDPQSILKAIDEDIDILRDFAPDVIHIFSCAARRTFWGKDKATYELEPLKGISDTNGFFSHGEFIKTKNHLNKHNVTLVLAALREGEIKGEKKNYSQGRVETKKIPLITRLSTFITETTNQINEVNKTLEQERMHYHHVLTNGCDYNVTGDLTEGIIRDGAYDEEGNDIFVKYHLKSPITFDECIRFYLSFHKIQYVNQSKREIGEILTPDEMMEKCNDGLTREGLLKQFEAGVTRIETVFYDYDWKAFIRISVYMSQNDINGHIFALVLVQDVTQQWNKDVEHERTLRNAIESANQASVAKSNFLANMSHEIRTPINAILGFNEMILRENRDSNINDYAADVRNAAEALLMLVNDVLDFSKIEAGKMEIVPLEYSLPKMLNSVMGMMNERAERKGLALYLNTAKDVPEMLIGDTGRIQQILINLLSNAIKYTEKGTVTLEVTGSVLRDEAVIRFSVKDTGIGIREEDISRLFNEFERIDIKRNRNIEGTGLGINITTGLLKLMDSKLEVTSEYGAGSEFAFTLKQKLTEEKRETPETIQKSKDINHKFQAPDVELLVVDDNMMNRKVLRSLLKASNIAVDEADSGSKCIEMVSHKKYDIIMLDHMMPEMDGIETLELIINKGLIDTSQTPVIALTANAVAGAEDIYIEKGFSDYLSKPVRPDDLEAMIIKHVPEDKIIR